jgi:pyridinium-3,5-bisthiocarboxylic acid mononucleotide nickel chelatase
LVDYRNDVSILYARIDVFVKTRLRPALPARQRCWLPLDVPESLSGMLTGRRELDVRIAYFDPFSGASGDMVLGALVDCGLPLDDLRSVLAGLRLEGWQLTSELVSQHGIGGTRVSVNADDDTHSRDWGRIRSILEDADLPEPVRTGAMAIFESLAHAEAHVHGADLDSVHFHEVGGVDAIVDIVGAAAGLHLLRVERVFSGPPALGRGFARSMHGTIPIPAPATAKLLANAKAPSRDADVEAELLTPTGAAILTTLAEFERPEFRATSVGYGYGRRELPWPNALRLWIGEMDESVGAGNIAVPSPATELLLETNVDDMNPEYYELLFERLFDAGALDVFMTPIIMKRGRPATKLSAIVAAEDRERVEQALIENSTTFGIRALPIERTKAGRDWETVATRWGDVRLKLKIWRGRVQEVAPEYADCVAIARQSDAPLRLIYDEARRIGDMFVGQRRTGVDGEGAGVDE